LIPLGVAADLRPTALENIQLRVGPILQHYRWYWQGEICVLGEASIGPFVGYTSGLPGRWSRSTRRIAAGRHAAVRSSCLPVGCPYYGVRRVRSIAAGCRHGLSVV